MPYLARICVYPVKALDGLPLTQATILPSGALRYDRTFAFVDEQGKYINGKRNPKVHRLRSSFETKERILTLRIQDSVQAYQFQVDAEREKLHVWLSEYFACSVNMIENGHAGFPDDVKAPGPTVISTATLQEVASWFPGLSEQEMRWRLRANLEIGGVSAFWEDNLFSEADDIVTFRIGNVLFEGTNPCQRCVVPSRNPLTGEAWPHFQQIFMRKREESLPAWATRSRFNHFYRLSCNTRVPASEAGKVLQIGDEVSLLS